MNKTVAALSISTAIFAASTVYLAHELNGRDGSGSKIAPLPAAAATPHASAPEATAASTGSTPAHTAIPAAGNAAQPVGLATPSDSKSQEAQDASADYARQFLARYDDANQHPVLLEEQRTVLRRQYEKLKERLKLSDSSFEQFVTLLAEEQLQWQERWARCAVDTSCDPRNQRNANIDHSQEYQAMLGVEGAEAFTQFRNSIGERDAVIQLRGRLTDNNFLPEAQAEKLIMALAEERERFSREAESRGAKVTGWGTNLGMLMYTEDSGQPEQYIVEASQYSQRLRSRAASILTPTQLAAYTQIQDELLAMFTSNHRPTPRQNKTSAIRAS